MSAAEGSLLDLLDRLDVSESVDLEYKECRQRFPAPVGCIGSARVAEQTPPPAPPRLVSHCGAHARRGVQTAEGGEEASHENGRSRWPTLLASSNKSAPPPAMTTTVVLVRMRRSRYSGLPPSPGTCGAESASGDEQAGEPGRGWGRGLLRHPRASIATLLSLQGNEPSSQGTDSLRLQGNGPSLWDTVTDSGNDRRVPIGVPIERQDTVGG